MLERNLLFEVPRCLKILAGQFDLVKLPEVSAATETSKGPLSFLTCGFAGMPDSSLRAMVFRPIRSEEWLCHVRLTIRPCSAFTELMEYELDYQTLSDLLRGTGIRTIDTAGLSSCAAFMCALDDEFMGAFRSSESLIKFSKETVTSSPQNVPLRKFVA